MISDGEIYFGALCLDRKSKRQTALHSHLGLNIDSERTPPSDKAIPQECCQALHTVPTNCSSILAPMAIVLQGIGAIGAGLIFRGVDWDQGKKTLKRNMVEGGKFCCLGKMMQRGFTGKKNDNHFSSQRAASGLTPKKSDILRSCHPKGGEMVIGWSLKLWHSGLLWKS